ncbi:MAG TPA: DivIVA domain-containing protein [Rubricoccaceae bacterium]|nr:DivIVA domain-containing protein [Rubricoccaceae bacterium]
MKLSPLDIRKHQFERAFRGFDPDEVRAFLTQVARNWEELLDEQRQAEERIRELEMKLRHYEKVEMALQEALETARDTARRKAEAADQQAKLVIEEAELRAQRIVQDAEQERYGLRQDLARLNHRQHQVAARLRAFLMSELEMLAQFQGDDPIGFIKLVAATEKPEALPLPPAPARLDTPMSGGPGSDEPELEEPAPLSFSEPLEEEPVPTAGVAPTPDLQATGDSRASEPGLEAWVRPEAPPAWGAALSEIPLEEEAPAAEASLPSTEGAAEETAEPPREGTEREIEESTFAARPDEEPAPRTLHDLLRDREVASEPPRRSDRFFDRPFLRNPFRTPDPPPPAPEAEPIPGSDAAQGWSLRSVVTGEAEEAPRTLTASEEEKERIRRILEDLD